MYAQRSHLLSNEARVEISLVCEVDQEEVRVGRLVRGLVGVVRRSALANDGDDGHVGREERRRGELEGRTREGGGVGWPTSWVGATRPGLSETVEAALVRCRG